MAWNISCVVNNMVIGPRKAMDLFDLLKEDMGWDHLECMYDDKTCLLKFNADDMEHMDYLSNRKVQEFLCPGAVGDVCFASLEGDNAGSFWGYRFTGWKCLRLHHKDVWTTHDPTINMNLLTDMVLTRMRDYMAELTHEMGYWDDSWDELIDDVGFNDDLDDANGQDFRTYVEKIVAAIDLVVDEDKIRAE